MNDPAIVTLIIIIGVVCIVWGAVVAVVRIATRDLD